MLIKQFKKDYISYSLGVLIPAAVNFLTIPFFKNILGLHNFGIYSFYFSLLIIITSSFSGGIGQSIIRLHVEYKEVKVFYYNCLWIISFATFLMFIPLFIYLQNSRDSVLFSILFLFSLLLSNLYTGLLGITQSNFKAASSAFAECIRTITFLVLSVCILVWLPSKNFLFVIFTSLSASFSLASFYLFYKNKLSFIGFLANSDLEEAWATVIQIKKYGGYLIIWFFLSYGVSMANRFVLAAIYGKENIGHFTASFDILYKSITLVLSPIVVSLFPIIVKASLAGNHTEVRRLIKKLSFIELALLFVAVAFFYLIGFGILSNIIRTPETSEYLIIDIQVIAGSFLWQIAIIQHKFFELQKRTLNMVFYIAIAFLLSILTDVAVISHFGIRYAGMGFCIGAMVYLLLIIYNKKNVLGLSKTEISY